MGCYMGGGRSDPGGSHSDPDGSHGGRAEGLAGVYTIVNTKIVVGFSGRDTSLSRPAR